jgi:hypothetical protein
MKDLPPSPGGTGEDGMDESFCFINDTDESEDVAAGLRCCCCNELPEILGIRLFFSPLPPRLLYDKFGVEERVSGDGARLLPAGGVLGCGGGVPRSRLMGGGVRQLPPVASARRECCELLGSRLDLERCIGLIETGWCCCE